MTIGKGRAWATPARGTVDIELMGSDADLARCVNRGGAAPLVRFRPRPPDDFARTLGLGISGPAGELEARVDAMLLEVDGDVEVAINAVEIGVAPDRTRTWTRSRAMELSIDGRSAWSGHATGVLVANGQFLRGADVVPRGHPGDGWIEVQVYALRAGDRRTMRSRLATGTHVPHPRILERRGRMIDLSAPDPVPIAADGAIRPPAEQMRITVLPGAIRMLL